MSHKKGCDNGEIHALAWETFEEATETAQRTVPGAGQDLLADAFSGNIRGIEQGMAEMEIEERTSEPVVAFMMDKTEPGAFNLPHLQDLRRSLQHRRPGDRSCLPPRLHF